MLKNVADFFPTKSETNHLIINMVSGGGGGVGENLLRAPAFQSGVVALESKPAINSECSTIHNILLLGTNTT